MTTDTVSGLGVQWISTEAVDLATACAIERTEARAWADLCAAVPRDHARKIGMVTTEIAGAFVVRCPGGGFHRGLFNRPIGLGVLEPASREAVAQVVEHFRRGGVDQFIVTAQPHCRPPELERRLEELGLRRTGAWDRIVRDDAPLAAAEPTRRELVVSRVDATTAEAWADFLCDLYRIDAGPWLCALADRPGWRHYVAHADGALVAARSMFLPAQGALAFLAVDGPVPGVMTADHEPDAAICRRIVADGLALGARGFVADIEAPSPLLDTPAYAIFGGLGFSRPYTRDHFAQSS